MKSAKRPRELQSKRFLLTPNHILTTDYTQQCNQFLSPYNLDSVIPRYWSKFYLNLIILNNIHLHKGQ